MAYQRYIIENPLMKILIRPCSYLIIYFIFLSFNSISQTQVYQQTANPSVQNPSKEHFKVPEPTGFVNDFENLFTQAEIKTLDSMIIAIHNKTSVQIAIISIDTMMINKDQLDDFTKQTFTSWGLQVNGQFNGILIGLSNAYKKLRIENGTGVEQALTNYEIQEIVESAFIPYFKDDKYYPGTINGLIAIMNKLKVK